MGNCIFSKAWIGKCNAETVEGTDFCTAHLPEKCCQCDEQATHDCAETFGLVCGYPLCSKEECKIKHHPQHYKLTPSRWAEIFKTEIPEKLDGCLDKVDYEMFRENRMALASLDDE